MHIFILFSIFVMIESGFYDSREKFSLNPGEVIQFIEKIIIIEDFEEIVSRFKVGTPATVLSPNTAPNTVKKSMNKIFDEFFVWCFNFKRFVELYMKTKLATYCTIAINLIAANENEKRDEQVKILINNIRFGTHDYCAASLLHNFKSIDISIFHTIFFLQTIDFEQITLDKLKNKLLGFIKEIQDFENNKEYVIILPNDIFNPGNIDNDGMFSQLSSIREKINNFSKIFCSSFKPPNINTDVFLKTEIPDHKDQFVDHVFQKAECKITFIKIEDDVETQRERITDWNCQGIEYTTQYGFDDFVLEIRERCLRSDYILPEWIQNINPNCGKIWKSVQNTLWGSKQENEPESKDKMLSTETKSRDYMFTLTSLKTNLKSNNYFLNVMLYSNIAADIMVYVSLQEGYKELQGIQHYFNEKCSAIFVCITPPEIIIMRSRLFMFKYYFDAFIKKILEKLHISVTRNKENTFMEVFNEKVNQVLYILTFSKNMEWKSYTNAVCRNIKRELDNIQYNFPKVKPTELELIKYYFHEPILTMYKLYQLI